MHAIYQKRSSSDRGQHFAGLASACCKAAQLVSGACREGQALRGLRALVLLTLLPAALSACGSQAPGLGKPSMALNERATAAPATAGDATQAAASAASPTPLSPMLQQTALAATNARQRGPSAGSEDGIRRGGGYAKIGNPYQIAGSWYHPKVEPDYLARGIASWYGDDFHGKQTANGELFHKERLTAAHKTLPLPSFVLVTNLDNNRALVVRINDRGPYSKGRLIDLSHRSARLLDFEHRGTSNVEVRYLGPAPLDGNNAREMAHLRQQSWYHGKDEQSALALR